MATEKSLGATAAKSATWTMGSQAGRILLQLASVLILSRLLGPEEFGVAAVALAVVGFGDVVRDFGLLNAAIQAPELSGAQRDNLFWINTLVGLCLAITLIVVSPLVAVAYGDGQLRLLLIALAATFLFNGLSTQHRAHLARTLRLRILAAIDLLGPTLGLLVAATMAASGAGPWALVMQQIGSSLTIAIAIVVAARWRPGRPKRGVHMRPMLAYGAHVLIAQIVNYASTRADLLVGGLRLGSADIGRYNRAASIASTPLAQINAPATRVAVPLLSRLQQDEARFRSFLLAGQNALLHLVFPVVFVLVAFPELVVRLALGDTWGGLGPIVQALAVAAVFRTVTYSTYWVSLARGLPKLSLWIVLVTAPVSLATVFATSRHGVVAMAWGMAGVAAFQWVVSLVIYARLSPAPVGALALNGMAILAPYAVSVVATLATLDVLGPDVSGSGLSLLIGLGYLAVGLGLACLAPVFRASLRSVKTAARMAVRR